SGLGSWNCPKVCASCRRSMVMWTSSRSAPSSDSGRMCATTRTAAKWLRSHSKLSTAEARMSDGVIIGAGMHPFGRVDKSYEQLGSEAAAAAVKDAGLEWKQIQAASLSRMYLPATSGARILRRLGSTDISIVDVEAACASGGAALRQAVLAIRSGEVDLVMVLGCEKMPRGFMDPSMIYSPWQIELGMCLNPAYWSMRAQRHMYDYGTTELQIAKVAYKNHRNSVHNPNAMYRKEFSLEEILNSPLVCDPIRRLEICAPDDGAAAVVVASAKR